MLRGGKSFKLSQAIRSKQVTLGILFVCVLIGCGILGYIWSQTDAQIDRGSKIGISVAFGSIIVANLLGLFVTAASKVFSLETSSTGYRYPASLRYMLYTIALTLGTLCIVIVSTNQITNKSTQTALAVSIGFFAVLSGLLGLYFHSTLLPIDFAALTDYSKKQGISSLFPKDLFLDDDFIDFLPETNFPSEVRDILTELHNSGDYTTFLQTLKELNYSDILSFREKVNTNRTFRKPYDKIFSKAEEVDKPGFFQTAKDKLQATKDKLQATKDTVKGKLQATKDTVSKLFETEESQVLDFAKTFFDKQGTVAFEKVQDLENLFQSKGFNLRPYYIKLQKQFPRLAREASLEAFKDIVRNQIQSGKSVQQVMEILRKFPPYNEFFKDKAISNMLFDYAQELFDPAKALDSIKDFVPPEIMELNG